MHIIFSLWTIAMFGVGVYVLAFSFARRGTMKTNLLYGIIFAGYATALCAIALGLQQLSEIYSWLFVKELFLPLIPIILYFLSCFFFCGLVLFFLFAIERCGLIPTSGIIYAFSISGIGMLDRRVIFPIFSLLLVPAIPITHIFLTHSDKSPLLNWVLYFVILWIFVAPIASYFYHTLSAEFPRAFFFAAIVLGLLGLFFDVDDALLNDFSVDWVFSLFHLGEALVSISFLSTVSFYLVAALAMLTLIPAINRKASTVIFLGKTTINYEDRKEWVIG